MLHGSRDLKKPTGIYVKLPSGQWIRIKGKISRVIIIKSKGKKSISFSLIGESIDKPPEPTSSNPEKLYISSFRVTKYILRLLDETNPKKYLIIIKPITKETYQLIMQGNSEEIEKAKRIAEEMKLVKPAPKIKKTTSS